MGWSPAALLLAAASLLLACAIPAAAAQAAQRCAGAPCGFIQPVVNIDIPGKKPCKAADRADCYDLPAKGRSLVLEGVVQYYWKSSEDGIYPQTDPGDPITLTFAGTASNPKWLTFKVEPATFDIGAAELADPANVKPGPNNVVYFWYERPITLTVTHAGDPTPAELDRLGAKAGVQQVLVKAKADPSGAYYREGFGIEEIRFEASSMLPADGTEGGKGSPAGGLLVGLAPLAALAALRRRRA